MVAVRADMTPQVARIAATRLGHRPRPLRLSYAGQVLRVQGSEVRPERQFGQVGAELIGAEGPAADVEVIAVAAEALLGIGVPNLSVDLTMPTLVPAIAEAFDIPAEKRVGAARARSTTRTLPRSPRWPAAAGTLLTAACRGRGRRGASAAGSRRARLCRAGARRSATGWARCSTD